MIESSKNDRIGRSAYFVPRRECELIRCGSPHWTFSVSCGSRAGIPVSHSDWGTTITPKLTIFVSPKLTIFAVAWMFLKVANFREPPQGEVREPHFPKLSSKSERTITTAERKRNPAASEKVRFHHAQRGE